MRDDFAVIIPTHGRPDVKTVKTLRNCNYTGKIYLLLDNEDDKVEEYHKKHGKENVLVFDKKAKSEARDFDIGDNFDDRRVVVYARNCCHEIAKNLGLKYFLELDDDYTDFLFRYEKDGSLPGKKIEDFNKFVDVMLEFLDVSGALTVCMAQGGDFIGGAQGGIWKKKITRKAMNSFFCRVDRPFNFLGRINEDTTAYVTHGHTGNLFFTISNVALNQGQTQANAGGLTDIYLANGTYVKSFYSVIFCPSAVKVGMMGSSSRRMHHVIDWNACNPKIINQEYKKSLKRGK